jgi:hypothetical protein
MQADEALVMSGGTDRLRLRRVRVGLVMGLVLSLAVMAYGLIAVGPWQAAPVESQTVLTESGDLTASYAPPPSGETAIDQAAAMMRAGQLLTRTDEASAVRARRMLLTLRTSGGAVAFEPRHVWLVVYEGRKYDASLGCTCYTQSQPNTTVVLDARDGQALMTFGSPR